jgi:hypothetical protein
VAIFAFGAFEGGTDDSGADVDFFAPKGLPEDTGIHHHVAASGLFVEFGTVEIDRELKVAGEFFFGGMTGFFDDNAKGVEVLFLEALKFADEDVPGMDETKAVVVTLDGDGAVGPNSSNRRAAGHCQSILSSRKSM